ncbi:hypothetical protein [Paracoccus sp. SSK6]|uniref:hypothetical protein n=1 Tax=Paracoccus sp. SSK6 TaxID=3143131 RepID=UPI00321A067B
MRAHERDDYESLESYLRKQGSISESDLILEVCFETPEDHGQSDQRLRIFVDVCEPDQAGNPSYIREVELDLTAADLFRFVKRFEVAEMSHGQTFLDEVVQHECRE